MCLGKTVCVRLWMDTVDTVHLKPFTTNDNNLCLEWIESKSNILRNLGKIRTRLYKQKSIDRWVHPGFHFCIFLCVVHNATRGCSLSADQSVAILEVLLNTTHGSFPNFGTIKYMDIKPWVSIGMQLKSFLEWLHITQFIHHNSAS